MRISLGEEYANVVVVLLDSIGLLDRQPMISKKESLK